MKIHTSHHYMITDGSVAGCYAWRHVSNCKWITVNVTQARETYPNLRVDKAIRTMAKEMFKVIESTELFEAFKQANGR